MSDPAPRESLLNFILRPTIEELIIEGQKTEVTRLTKENDIQRASIQQLSAQVVGMQRVVDAAKVFLDGPIRDFDGLRQALSELESSL